MHSESCSSEGQQPAQVPEALSQASSLAIVPLTCLGPFLLLSPLLAFYLPTQWSGIYSPNSYTNRSHTGASLQEMMDCRYRLWSLGARLSSSQVLASVSLPLSLLP